MKVTVPLASFLLLLLPAPLFAQQLPKTVASDLTNPESVAVGNNGRVYVSLIGESNKDGDGSIAVLNKGKAVPFCTGLDDPKGIAYYHNWLFVADKTRILKIDKTGKATVFVRAKAFPRPPLFLNDLVADPESGTLYVSDSGDLQGNKGAVYRINKNGFVSLLTDEAKLPGLHTPNGLVMDGRSHVRLVDFGTGKLYRLRVSDGKAEKLAEGFDGGDGLAWDMYGQLFVTSCNQGKVYGIPRPGENPVLVTGRFQSAADLCLDPTKEFLLVPDMKAGTITAMAATIPGAEVDTTPMPFATEIAFPKLKLTGWKGITEKGLVRPLRPIVLTHAGDGSNRVFLATQRGVIHVFPNDQKAQKTKVFLDIEKKVFYYDKENEQGLLGVAFHPSFKNNGEFFVFYTLTKPRLTNVLSRFRVSKDDPDRADPNSEEEIFRIRRPFWNHDGGTIVFGPDGYLYVALGDGGAANDPFNNGQNLKTPLGTILRIDVDRKDPGKRYAVPKDNPFVGDPSALPEIWAYGLRNVWRMAFDKKTGKLWAGEVGQNLYEEINIIEKGGNYGWKLREALHPFSLKGVGVRKDLIDPIWEYHHDIGKSITGGAVYRGRQFPELQGSYIYGDYVSGKIWALNYDSEKKRVTANRPIKDRNLPILSFGEDERGEMYLLTTSVTGQGVFRFAKAPK